MKRLQSQLDLHEITTKRVRNLRYERTKKCREESFFDEMARCIAD